MTKTELLKYVRKTNPDMTMEKLIHELNKTPSSSICLFMIAKNS